MYDASKVTAGLIVFCVLVTTPLWFPAISGESMAPPKLTLPADAKQCVEQKERMRETHMEILNTWRDQVVRQGKRAYTASDGKKYAMSLTGTCLGCHGEKKEFCDACHSYLAVAPYCWSCHVDPKEVK